MPQRRGRDTKDVPQAPWTRGGPDVKQMFAGTTPVWCTWRRAHSWVVNHAGEPDSNQMSLGSSCQFSPDLAPSSSSHAGIESEHGSRGPLQLARCCRARGPWLARWSLAQSADARAALTPTGLLAALQAHRSQGARASVASLLAMQIRALWHGAPPPALSWRARRDHPLRHCRPWLAGEV